jgi:hypothetical protein
LGELQEGAIMSKHTPGPWTVDDLIITAPKLRDSDLCTEVCVILDDDDPIFIGLAEADARLIAAAPEQHEALRTISEGTNGIIDNWEHWTADYKKQHLLGLQSVAMDAYKKAEAL